MYGKSTPEVKQEQIVENIDPKNTVTPPILSDQDILEPKVPELPQTPELEAPSPPPIPTKEETKKEMVVANLPSTPEKPAEIASNAPVNVPMPPAINNNAANAKFAERLKSSLTVVGGSGGNSSNGKAATTATASTVDIEDAGSDGTDAIPLTSNRVTATRIGNMNRVITQGRMIDAVLDSAVNTDVAGMVRAVVSRDIYSEAGTNVLIPRGSKLIGSYAAGATVGQERVQITWDRLIRPDGIDIALASAAADPLGTAGIKGDVNNKYLQMFTIVMLKGMFNIGLGAWKDNEDDTSGSTTTTYTTTNTDGSTTVVTSSTQATEMATAISDTADDVKSLGDDIVDDEFKNTSPTITIPQGTLVRVFVAKDLVFPLYSANAGLKVVK
jgi:type IV secretion system protein VirB10